MPEQLVESINDTARMARTMLSLLLVAALVVVLILSFSNDENLFRDVSVELPQIGIGISIEKSYIVAPLIFLYLHIQVLYLLNVLARGMRAFMREPAHQEHFDRLSAFVFIQLYRDQHLLLFPWLLFWSGVVVIPLALLFAMDLSFVRYQSGITLGHHIIFIIDLVFVMWSVWAVWPSCSESRRPLRRTTTFRAARRVIRRMLIRNISSNMIVMSVAAVFVISILLFLLYFFVDTTMEYPDSIFGGFLIFLVVVLIFVRRTRLGRVACDEFRRSRVVNGVIISTAVISVFITLFLFHSVKPPRFDTETIYRDRECIWRDDGKKDDIKEEDASCSNYIDRFLCKWLGICRYLNLRYKWLTSTQTVDLADLVTDELGDRRTEYSLRSVNNLHVVDRNFRFADFRNAALHGADFRKAKLEGADFTLAELHSAKFPEAQLRNTTFRRSESRDAVFIGSKSQSVDFEHAALQGASFHHTQLQGSNFKDAKLTGAFFVGAGLQGVNFKDARLQAADFEKAELQGANFEGAILDGAELVGARLQGVNFSGAQLEGADLGGAQLQGSFYEEKPGSWKLAWMPDVSFRNCPEMSDIVPCNYTKLYNKILQRLGKNLDVRLAWDKNDQKGTSLEDHLEDYLTPNTDRRKLDCGLLQDEKGSVVCYESKPYYNKDWGKKEVNDWNNRTVNLAILMGQLACKDGYSANRIFSRWTKDENVLSDDDRVIHLVRISPDADKASKAVRSEMRGGVFKILDCERKKKDRSRCPGLQTIPDGKWSQWWTKFGDELPESSCIKPNPFSYFLISEALPVR